MLHLWELKTEDFQLNKKKKVCKYLMKYNIAVKFVSQTNIKSWISFQVHVWVMISISRRKQQVYGYADCIFVDCF